MRLLVDDFKSTGSDQRQVFFPVHEQGIINVANQGRHEVEVDAAYLPAGIYLLSFGAGQTVETGSVVLLK
jgi:hypothetical protein